MIGLLAKFQDESTLLWYYGKDEKQLDLRQILRIIPGQRTVSLLCLSLFFILSVFIKKNLYSSFITQHGERTCLGNI